MLSCAAIHSAALATCLHACLSSYSIGARWYVVCKHDIHSHTCTRTHCTGHRKISNVELYRYSLAVSLQCVFIILFKCSPLDVSLHACLSFYLSGARCMSLCSVRTCMHLEMFSFTRARILCILENRACLCIYTRIRTHTHKRKGILLLYLFLSNSFISRCRHQIYWSSAPTYRRCCIEFHVRFSRKCLILFSIFFYFTASQSRFFSKECIFSHFALSSVRAYVVLVIHFRRGPLIDWLDVCLRIIPSASLFFKFDPSCLQTCWW